MNNERNIKGQFEKIYLNSDNPVRDRFQVEFNKEERSQFTDMQIWIDQSKDATAIKQWAVFGYLTISNHALAMEYLRDTLFKNKLNNKRNGIDVKTEIEHKFQQFIEKNGGKL